MKLFPLPVLTKTYNFMFVTLFCILKRFDYEGANTPVNREEMACEEAELGPVGFGHKMEAQQQLHEQVMSALVITKQNVHV